MIKVSELPQDPFEAISSVCSQVISEIGSSATNLTKLKNSNHPLYRTIYTARIVCIKCSRRLGDPSAPRVIEGILETPDDITVNDVAKKFDEVLHISIALNLDNHFLSEDTELFDSAKLSDGEKTEIFNLFKQARSQTLSATSIPEKRKRRVLYFISRAENEVAKEVSGFQAFMAAAYEVKDLVKEYGEATRPIAESIEKARTITEKKISGTIAIEAEEKRKQLPKPSESETSSDTA